MAYRDDRDALVLQIADLERQNEDLREQVSELREDAKRDREKEREQRSKSARRDCVVCGGTLHAVALFAGKVTTPRPLLLSTSRFMDSEGGFTRATAVKALACSSCGFVHHFMDMDSGEVPVIPAADSGSD